MPRAVDAALLAALNAKTVGLALLFEGFFWGNTVRFWTGIGVLAWNGFSWNGAGELIQLGPAQETAEMKAVGVSITLSGIPPDMLGLVFDELRQGQRVNVYIAALNTQSGAIIGTPCIYFSGRVDVAQVDEAGDAAAITLQVENRFVDFEKQRSLYYTPATQALFFPGDTGFAQVAALQDQKIFWGISS
jgi:hypothetical protein